VWNQKEYPRYGHPSVPDSHSVQTTERVLDRGQECRQNERQRQQDDRLYPEELSDEAASRLVRWARHHPQHEIADGDQDKYQRSEERGVLSGTRLHPGSGIDDCDALISTAASAVDNERTLSSPRPFGSQALSAPRAAIG
jgi:hypothetical protein